jgi:spoIIIJ-associated protein
MEWVETTGKSLDQAMDLALDQLGVAAEDAEFEVLEEPRTGLFGRVRGEARVRARVRPATVRPKQDRRARRRAEGRTGDRPTTSPAADGADDETDDTPPAAGGAVEPRRPRDRGGRGRRPGKSAAATTTIESTGSTQGETMSNDQQPDTDSDDAEHAAVDVAEVQRAAETFAGGLVDAFGLVGTTSSTVDGNEIEVRIDAEGDGLGLLIGPGGRTLLAIQDLARVAAQRRLGDHDTRLRIDVAGYREKRRVALERFARNVADLVKESGIARSLDPMPSADRKVIHDTLSEIEGVVSRSEGEDPNRRIIVSPA